MVRCALSRALLAIATLLLGQQCFAATTAYYWRGSCTGCTNQTSPGAAAAQALQICQQAEGVSPPNNCGSTSCTNATNDHFELQDITPGVWPAYQYRLVRIRPGTGAQCIGNQINMTTTVKPDGNEECPAAGTRRGSIQNEEAAPGDAVCGNDGCSYTIVDSPPVRTELNGGSGTLVTVESKGRACNSSHETVDLPTQENSGCDDAGGTIACIDPEAPPGQGCGYFNADYVCTGHVPDDKCVEFASGGVACVADSPDVPKQADGTTPAVPVGSVSAGDQTVNYYDPQTVADSPTPVATSPGQGGSANGAPGRDGSGSSSGGGSGGATTVNCAEGVTPCVNNGTINNGGAGGDDGDNDEDGVCEEGEDCNNPELGEVCTFGDCAATFYNRIKAAPLVAGVLSAGAAMPAGSCPNWSLAAFESDYSLSAPMCEIWDQISPLLSAVFLVIWGWVATRIVLSA